MQELLETYGKTVFKKLKVDGIQYILDAYISNPYFPWVCLILLLNYKNWKRPVILILVGHWFFRATGDLLRNTMYLRKQNINMYWPYSLTNWYISNGVAHIFWLSGEIIGDWYLLIRTTAVTLNKRKRKFVYITCVLHNFVKIFGMCCYFLNYPMDLRQMDENGVFIRDIVKHGIAWWSTIAVMQITSLLYDLSVINALKSYLFDKINMMSQNNFMEKFKQISEFRIFFSIIFSIVFLPFVVSFVIFLLSEYRKQSTVQYVASDSGIEQLRQVVLNFNYTIMYIDQILLRCYIGKSNIAGKNSSYTKMNSSNLTYKNYSKMNDTTLTTLSDKSMYSQYPTTSSKSMYSGTYVTLPKSPLFNGPSTNNSPLFSSPLTNTSININDYFSTKPYSNSQNENQVSYEIKEINDKFVIKKFNEETFSNNTLPHHKKIGISNVSDIKPFDY